MSDKAKARDEWFGDLQSFLELHMQDAPDDTCRILADSLLQQTYDFTDDDE